MASSNFAAGAYAAVQNIGGLKGAPKIQPTQGAAGSNFQSLLSSALDSVGETGRNADAGASPTTSTRAGSMPSSRSQSRATAVVGTMTRVAPRTAR